MNSGAYSSKLLALRGCSLLTLSFYYKLIKRKDTQYSIHSCLFVKNENSAESMCYKVFHSTLKCFISFLIKYFNRLDKSSNFFFQFCYQIHVFAFVSFEEWDVVAGIFAFATVGDALNSVGFVFFSHCK